MLRRIVPTGLRLQAGPTGWRDLEGHSFEGDDLLFLAEDWPIGSVVRSPIGWWQITAGPEDRNRWRPGTGIGPVEALQFPASVFQEGAYLELLTPGDYAARRVPDEERRPT